MYKKICDSYILKSVFQNNKKTSLPSMGILLGPLLYSKWGCDNYIFRRDEKLDVHHAIVLIR